MVAERRVDLRTLAGQRGSHRPQFPGDLVRRLLDVAAAVSPGFGYRRKKLQESRFGIVGAAEERPPVGRQEARHGPAALPGQRNGGVHVDGVDVGPLLAVHFDADEAVIHRRGHLVVLERLMCHHVTPVAGRVADREQDRRIASRGVGQCCGRPLLPVHRVVGVLAKVGAGGPSELVSPRAHGAAPPHRCAAAPLCIVVSAAHAVADRSCRHRRPDPPRGAAGRRTPAAS